MVQYFKASVRSMQGVAAKNDASYDLSRARASVTGQTTIVGADQRSVDCTASIHDTDWQRALDEMLASVGLIARPYRVGTLEVDRQGSH